MQQPIKIHPENPKLFEFRGRPLVLVTATEHYGAVINRPFDFEHYLADAAKNKMTMTRLFTLFRELQSPVNPYSTCKPESTDYISPFIRIKSGKALDGQPLYDLDTWNPEFFDRLHRFLSLASNYSIIVEITLLSNTYCPQVWTLNPLYHLNNINSLDETSWQEYNTKRNEKLFNYQIKHTRRIVEETKQYDNIIYEICNEPGGFNNPTDANLPAPSEIDDWQMSVADAIRDVESGSEYKHLISGQEAFSYDPFTQSSMKSFRNFNIDIVNMHPLPNTTYGDKVYNMGEFMSKQLNLQSLKNYCLDTYHEPKPMNFDEDNAASQYKDADGWTIHRKRAWTTLMIGGHYDYIDFSIVNGMESGTIASREHIRSWMRNLSEFIHSLDLVRSQPICNIVKQSPDKTLVCAFGDTQNEVCVYIADTREIDDDDYGKPIAGMVICDISGGWDVSFYSPVTGMYSPEIELSSYGSINIVLPEFKHDIVIKFKRKYHKSK